MSVTDNKTGAPLEHYQTVFAGRDPCELSARSGIAYRDGAFHTSVLSRPVSVSYPDMRVFFDDTEASPAWRILLGRFLLEGTVAPPNGSFLAYRELPWGSVYNTQFTNRCIRRLAASYGADLEKLAQACETLHGKRVRLGDMAYELELLPGLTLRLAVWEGDDEFAPTAQILFSDNFPAAFTAEDIAVVGDLVLNALRGRF